jgi:hypothetical protein
VLDWELPVSKQKGPYEHLFTMGSPDSWFTKFKWTTAVCTASIMFVIWLAKGSDAAECLFYRHLPSTINYITDMGISDAMIEARRRYCR